MTKIVALDDVHGRLAQLPGTHAQRSAEKGYVRITEFGTISASYFHLWPLDAIEPTVSYNSTRAQFLAAQELQTLSADTLPPVSNSHVPHVPWLSVKNAQVPQRSFESVDLSWKPSERRRLRWLSGSVSGLKHASDALVARALVAMNGAIAIPPNIDRREMPIASRPLNNASPINEHNSLACQKHKPAMGDQ